MKKFQDKLLLIVTGIVASILAWCFWHFLGAEIFLTLLMLQIFFENRELKKELTQIKKDLANLKNHAIEDSKTQS